jgi:hypothetical protein
MKENRLEKMKGVPSFSINDLQKEYKISQIDMEELEKIVPKNIADRESYLLIICRWFVSGIAIPVLKECINKYLEALLKGTMKKINITTFNNFSDFRNLINSGEK